MSKYIALALGLLLACNSAFAVGPIGVTGQNQSPAKYPTVIKTPNNQVSDLGSSSVLLETGNKNILANPSFEAVVNGPMTGWSWTGILTTNADSTIVIDGKQSQLLQPPNQALDFHADSTLYQAQFADGVQGLAYMRVKTTLSTTPLYVCPRKAGAYPSQMTSGCVQVQPTGKWGLYKVPFILGGTSNGIGITTNGVAVTDNIYVDDAFVGAVDLKQDVDQSRIAGASYFAGAASCTWTRTSATIGGFTATAACPGPTIEDGSMGQWQTTDSDLPRQTITNLPKGKYKATFFVSQYNAASSLSSMAISDGSTVCKEVAATAGSSQGSVTVSCVFNYNSSGDRSFELYGASGVSTITIDNRNTASINSQTKFILEYFGSGSVYSSTNADTDWTACNFSTLAWQGLGTVTNNLQCKRQGGDLLLSGYFTSGTVAAAEARLALPTWNGSQLSVKAGTKALSLVGSNYRSSAAGAVSISTSGSGLFQATASDAFITFGFHGASNSGTTKQQGSAIFVTGEDVRVEARIPIDGWDNSNIIIGQFNGLESCANSAQCETEYYADISASAAVSGQEITFISGCTLSTNTFTCTYSTPFAQTPMCEITPGAGATQAQKTAESASSISYIIYNATGSPTNVAHSISCRKRGSDYVAKSARAVASDQNVATPGVTKVKACYYSFAGASGTVASPTECTTGTCVEVEDTCNAIAAPPRTSIGTYTVTISSGTFAPNALLNVDAKAYSTSAQIRECYNYNNSAQTWAANSSGGATLTLGCIGATGTSSDAFARLRIEGQAP